MRQFFGSVFVQEDDHMELSITFKQPMVPMALKSNPANPRTVASRLIAISRLILTRLSTSPNVSWKTVLIQKIYRNM